MPVRPSLGLALAAALAAVGGCAAPAAAPSGATLEATWRDASHITLLLRSGGQDVAAAELLDLLAMEGPHGRVDLFWSEDGAGPFCRLGPEPEGSDARPFHGMPACSHMRPPRLNTTLPAGASMPYRLHAVDLGPQHWLVLLAPDDAMRAEMPHGVGPHRQLQGDHALRLEGKDVPLRRA